MHYRTRVESAQAAVASVNSKERRTVMTGPTPMEEDDQASVSSMSSCESRTDTKRRVKFAEDVKVNDGLRTDSAVFDFLMTHFFLRQNPVGELDVLEWTSGRGDLLTGLLDRLADLCTRISEGSALAKQNGVAFDGAPTLPLGGGYGTKLGVAHIPYLVTLRRVVLEAVRVRQEVLNEALAAAPAAPSMTQYEADSVAI
jgi:hypothetical protein